jgi:hypothetical protein
VVGSFPLLLGASFSQISAASTWEKHFSWDYNEEGRAIVATPDGGFAIAGSTNSYGPGAPDRNNAFLMRLDSLGNMLWYQVYGSPLEEVIRSAALTPDGGFIMCGTRVGADLVNSEYYVIKTDAAGRLQWERTYGHTSFPLLCDANSVTPIRLGGYAIAGTVASYYGDIPGEFMIVRINMSGDVMWQRKWNVEGYSTNAWSIQETPGGGLMVAGTLVGGDRKIIVTNFNFRGNLKWSRDFDLNGYCGAYSARLTRDGGTILGGYTLPAGAYTSQALLLKTDPNGGKQWYLVYRGASRGATIWSAQQVADGGYIATGGTSDGDLLLLRTGAAGNLLWARTFGTPSYGELGYAIIQAADGDYALTGYEYSWGPGENIYAIKTDQNGNVLHLNLKGGPGAIRLSPLQTTATPNPFVSYSTVAGKGSEIFSVYDVLGRRVGQYRGERIGSDLLPGVYLLRPNDGNGAAVRIVKTR